jgi:hypothetical protein
VGAGWGPAALGPGGCARLWVVGGDGEREDGERGRAEGGERQRGSLAAPRRWQHHGTTPPLYHAPHAPPGAAARPTPPRRATLQPRARGLRGEPQAARPPPPPPTPPAPPPHRPHPRPGWSAADACAHRRPAVPRPPPPPPPLPQARHQTLGRRPPQRQPAPPHAGRGGGGPAPARRLHRRGRRERPLAGAGAGPRAAAGAAAARPSGAPP